MTEMLSRLPFRGFDYMDGQTMTEYALILAAVAALVFVGYEIMGNDIQSLLNFVDSQL